MRGEAGAKSETWIDKRGGNTAVATTSIPTTVVTESMVAYRELVSSDVDAVCDVWVKTWDDAKGAEEMQQMGITPETVLEAMK